MRHLCCFALRHQFARRPPRRVRTVDRFVLPPSNRLFSSHRHPFLAIQRVRGYATQINAMQQGETSTTCVMRGESRRRGKFKPSSGRASHPVDCEFCRSTNSQPPSRGKGHRWQFRLLQDASVHPPL